MQETKERQIKINNKGITLVALVITVIVLLILATVGIGAIVGEDGLITKAQEAAELYEQASRNEANAINEIFNMVNGGNQGGSEEPTQPVIDATNTNVQFIYTPSTPTKGSVTVEITTTTGYMIQYRKGETGNYSRYTGAFTVEENTAIYAKLANSSGVTGGYITGNVQNIDKIAPNEFTPTIGTITTNSIVVNARTEDTGSIGCAAVNTGIKEYRYYANGVLQHTGLEESVTITGLTAGTEYSIYVIAEDKAGNTTTSNAVTAETIETITAAKINQNPSLYYGKEVVYTPQNGAPVGWKIFYADNENIYLIADDYVENKYAPNASNGINLDKTGSYNIFFNTIGNNSTAYAVINDTRVTKWISKLNNFTATNKGMKATAYLLDINIWSNFKDANDKAEYAIGAPTLEMFVKSYNNINLLKTIQCEETDEIGYHVKWNDGSYVSSIDGLNVHQNLYIISNQTNATSYWIASPGGYLKTDDEFGPPVTDVAGIDYGRMCNVSGNGTLYTSVLYNDRNTSFRPIICLKSEIQLIEQNGKYIIQ